MRIKKGFTLAEVLIVLMVIGVIATMTIPSLMKGVTEAQYKAAYKKAYNAIVNLTAMEKISGQLPTKPTADQAVIFMSSMASSLSTKEYVASNAIDSGVVVVAGAAKPGCKVTAGDGEKTTVQLGKGDTVCNPPSATDNTGNSGWIVTEDGLAYSIVIGTGVTATTDCGMKSDILQTNSAANAAKTACLVVVVDTNGLYKGPNRLERQTVTSTDLTTAGDYISGGSATKMVTLTRDRYYIYVGSDGATHGPTAYTVSGRIVNDLK